MLRNSNSPALHSLALLQLQVTFLKRKNGLLKKAMELGVLCDCEVNVVIFNLNNGKLFEYSSVDAEKIFMKYATYNGPSERRKKTSVRRGDF
jgi:SRF-type transcription factor (DNA-binding and dimerisation domain)